MAITLKTLLQAAPFPQEQRDKLLAIYDNLTGDQRFKLSEAAWTGLSIQYHSKLKYEFDKLNLEITEGKRKYNPNDFEEARAKLLHEFTQKLEAAESETEIEEVRSKLEQYKTQPFAQDKPVSSLPRRNPPAGGEGGSTTNVSQGQ